MSAFFSTFTLSEPDSDGDIRPDLELTVTNEGSQPIHRIQYRVWLLDEQQACLMENDSYEDVFLPPGESTTISCGSYFQQRNLRGTKVTARAIVVLCRRDFIRLGEMAIPDSDSSTRLQAELNFEWHGGPATILFSRSAPDGDGDFNLEFSSLISNRTEQSLKSVILKLQLLDSEEAEIETSEAEDEIPAHSAKLLSGSFWRPKANLDGGKALVSLKGLIPVDRVETTEVADLDEA